MSISTSIALLISILTMSAGSHAGDEMPVLEGPYLGQKTPGLTPEVFAPGVVSKEYRDLSGFFSKDMNEFYFTRRNPESGKWTLIGFKSENNRWRQVSEVPRVGRPIFSPDGKIMHLGKHYKERTESGWSEVKSLGVAYEDIRIMRLSSSLDGMYVLDEATRNGKGAIRYSQLVDGKRTEPTPFGKEINTGTWNAHPFIAPDESYIIWDGERETGYGGSDVFISFREPDGSWGAALNLGDKINTEAEELGAAVTPDGKYLFFNRVVKLEETNSPMNIDIYWVDAQIIEALRP